MDKMDKSKHGDIIASLNQATIDWQSVLSKLSEIPIGKGMAGIAAERRQPVEMCNLQIEMCNLQTDTSEIARPGAKVEGSKNPRLSIF